MFSLRPGARHGLAWTALGLMLGLLASGCKRGMPVLVRVQGRMETRSGALKAPLVLVLHPSDPTCQGNMPSAILTGGSFDLPCLPGRYRATLSPLHQRSTGSGASEEGREARARGPRPAGFTIPPVYRQAESSPWEVTIPVEGTSDLVLQLR